jgi:hypothetical protein
MLSGIVYVNCRRLYNPVSGALIAFFADPFKYLTNEILRITFCGRGKDAGLGARVPVTNIVIITFSCASNNGTWTIIFSQPT